MAAAHPPSRDGSAEAVVSAAPEAAPSSFTSSSTSISTSAPNPDKHSDDDIMGRQKSVSSDNSNGDDRDISPSKSRDSKPPREGGSTRASSPGDEDRRNGGRGIDTLSSSTNKINSSQTTSLVAGYFTPYNPITSITRGRHQNAFFSASKIKHLKKPDGIPLWRKDIQYEFLHAIFSDDKKVFTNSYDGRKEQSFADIYIDAMARSSKTSRILRDKLMTERKNALNMAMVCLLVNVGRMNTTLNFFPEMKAQLRTYHAIPSLQTYTDPHAYKQLQDAPRLKSILKGACEDRKEPVSLEALRELDVPRTNPINLVFILSTYAPKVSELHFPESRDFYDLVMRPTLSSRSRARAFLWLMWWYLESDFTTESALHNPYGKGLERKEGDVPCRVPEFEHLTEEQAANENVDTPEEVEFGSKMQEERKKLIEEISAANLPSKSRKHLARSPSGDMSPSGSPPSTMVTPTGGSRSVRNFPRGRMSKYSAGETAQDYDSDPHNNHSVSPDRLLTSSANGKQNRRSSANVTRIPDLFNNDELLLAPENDPPIVKNKGGRPKGSGKRNADGELKGTPRIILRTSGKRASLDPSGFSITAARSILPSAPGGDKPSPLAERTPKSRPMTSHQLAVQQNRKDRADYVIDKKLRRMDARKKKSRTRESIFRRTWDRIKDMEDPFANSDDEMYDDIIRGIGGSGATAAGEAREDENQAEKHPEDVEPAHKKLKTDRHPDMKYFNNGTTNPGPAGLIPKPEEEDDYGEEAMSLAAALRRTNRRLDRWEQQKLDLQETGGLRRGPKTRPQGGENSPNAEEAIAEGNGEAVENDIAGGSMEGDELEVAGDETRYASDGDEDEEMDDDGEEDPGDEMDAD
ncbi:hypothetical protein RUND412_005385 [Rhizina undulata]